MVPRADAAALNVQPRQRRQVYEALASAPAGRSAKDLINELDMPERDLRESLRKLDEAGLVLRVKGVWNAVPLETLEPAAQPAPETAETA